MRPTDFCHPNELRAPAPCAFPARSRSFRCVDAPRRLRLRAVLPGDRTFHDARRPLRRIVIEHSSRALLPHGLETRAWAFSSHGAGCDRASDTPVASSRSPSASPAFAGAATWPRVLLLEGFVRVGGCVRTPRPPLTPSRESRRLLMIQDAFHRQGPFVGSGGPYSPGPATSAPLLAM
jgi:hypothetical protein